MLPLVAAGGLVLALWQGRGRAAGLAPLLVAALLWGRAERPDLLVSESGGLAGVLTEAGRGLSRPRGDGFAAGIWLENDGAGGTEQAIAAGRGVAAGTAHPLAGLRLLHVTGKRGLAAVTGCGGADLLVVNVIPEAPRPCLTLDPALLRRTGSVAGWATPAGLRLESAAARAGKRLWTPHAGPPAELPALLAPRRIAAHR
ncbi:competence protein [Oceanicola granulosus HTCC2516]|uniref:Competence protein n=1 Tax=Oceanicola granulosus (strain ATCC BAA-861 / DSM 15982 / KCTC 12143 / HTCC2516) TaxID=314256 RepID=Q2CG18_OCEGH|nr:competence protein [Oceanicola granulosus HTCC2516]